MTRTTLLDDVARCRGVSLLIGSDWEWRQGCEDCLRRTAPRHPHFGAWMGPPPVVDGECEYRIAP